MARFTRGSQTETLPVETQAAPAARRADGPKPFPNKFGAKCVDCGVYVPEGTGNTTRNPSGKWEVRHNQPCPEPTPLGQDSMGDINGPGVPAPSARNFSVPDGRYTIIWGDHYQTLRVETQDVFATFMPGAVVLKYLSGANNDRDFTGFGHVDERGEVRVWKKHQANETLREAVKVLLGDPKAASQAYARESGQCGVCNRTLTTPESLAAMIGPECAKRVKW